MNQKQWKSDILYIEGVGQGLMMGPCVIGRASFSKTGRTIYFHNRAYRPTKGGYKSNYYDVETGVRVWISNPKRNGGDTLYPQNIDIEPDVQEKYWTKIRRMPEMVGTLQIRSEGKYSKRRPEPVVGRQRIHGRKK
jgi:hypothetical protein